MRTFRVEDVVIKGCQICSRQASKSRVLESQLHGSAKRRSGATNLVTIDRLDSDIAKIKKEREELKQFLFYHLSNEHGEDSNADPSSTKAS
jgi:hypothetical protein